jgi:hypothetical protein
METSVRDLTTLLIWSHHATEVTAAVATITKIRMIVLFIMEGNPGFGGGGVPGERADSIALTSKTD